MLKDAVAILEKLKHRECVNFALGNEQIAQGFREAILIVANEPPIETDLAVMHAKVKYLEQLLDECQQTPVAGHDETEQVTPVAGAD